MLKAGVESYIVRIYRRSEKEPGTIVGLVEVVESGELIKFGSEGELFKALSRGGGTKKMRAKGRKDGF